jgi:tetratricopeptide (TPR) repeat protein
LEPDVYKDVDEHEFNEITEKKHGLKPPLIISSKQKSYLERGNKMASKQEFQKAIEFYDLGLRENEIAFISHLHFNRGICLFHLRKFSEATYSFNEAVKIDKTYQPKVLSFISQFKGK